jgi:hypothetical protein
MALPRTAFAWVVAAPLMVLACTSSPGGSGGSGGAVSTSGGGSTAAGGALGTGGNAAGGATTGGASSGGSSSGGNSSGDGGAGFGSGGLGGETATGGADSSGGAVGVGGTGGPEPYASCDPDLGNEDNPACATGEVCFQTTCFEPCPTDAGEAATYECAGPDVSSSTAFGRCDSVVGRCELYCQGINTPILECPAGMTCDLGACVWP